MRAPGRIAAALAAGALAACAAFEEAPDLACPEVVVLKEARELVRFAPGGGRAETDALFRARVEDFAGTCRYREDGVDVALGIGIALERIRAPDGAEAAFSYFVALPAFHPMPEGKRVVAAAPRFAPGRTRLAWRDRLGISIPLDDPAAGPGTLIVLGLQPAPGEPRRRPARP